MAKHTIKTLSTDLNSFKHSVNEKFKTMEDALKTIKPQVQEVHEWIIRSEGFESGRASVKKDGTINFDPRVFDVVKWLVLAVVLALGGAKFL